MSFLSKVFGGKKEDKAPTTGEAIQKLRETEEMLGKKQEFLEKKIEQELAVARKNGTKNKRGKFFFILEEFMPIISLVEQRPSLLGIRPMKVQ